MSDEPFEPLPPVWTPIIGTPVAVLTSMTVTPEAFARGAFAPGGVVKVTTDGVEHLHRVDGIEDLGSGVRVYLSDPLPAQDVDYHVSF